MSEELKGFLAMVTAASIWGLSSMLIKALDHVPALELLAHRTIWAALFFLGLLAVQRRLRAFAGLWHTPKVTSRLVLAAALISVNWLCFILAVQSGRALSASLGYYMFPLVAVLLGRVVLGERLRPLQAVAVALAGLAVVSLTIGLGVPPWLSLILATTFGLYGLIKARLAVGPVLSVGFETSLVAPLSVIFLLSPYATGGLFGWDAWTMGLLVASGVLITALPLILFSAATRRLPYGTVGLIQYLNPTLQFLVATFVFLEPVRPVHMAALVLIWAGLALYSRDMLRASASSRAKSAGTSATGVSN
ncbi:EamA family transporter RarD [Oceanomicrobium pacificus]|uniref:EamA family transporter RarD n=1 Tax=Oceanomicrobium pacificus TaxID=2692916 RepID=A0A6B0TP30_9RHOB|nr:EamA family transporter RarD [Oceanomicrobium pacificus]MXU65636.1 EamA family transporter RarD [Oceanomicrobium pacificus]